MKKLLLTLAVIAGLVAPRAAEASPAFLFIATAGVGAFVATEYEACKADGIDAEDCAKKLWAERKRVPITQKVYNEDFNQ